MSKRKLEVAVVADLVSSMTDDETTALKMFLQQPPPELQALVPLMERMNVACQTLSLPPHKRAMIPTRAATDFENTRLAAEALGVEYKDYSPDYAFNLKETELKSTNSLSPHFATVVEELHSSKYLRYRCDEAISRTILDLILIDRLRILQDQDAHHHLCLSAEVQVSVKVKDLDGQDEMIRGRADWALGYGKDKSDTGSILIVAEAKGSGKASVGLPQLMVYMAAVFESRRDKLNNSVFGMLADGITFQFTFLDHTKKLFVSNGFQWSNQKSTILSYIDTILLDAIKSSPHTTPTKTQNTSLRRYPQYLVRQWKFGEDSEDEADDEASEDDFVDVIKDRHRIVLRTTRKGATLD